MKSYILSLSLLVPVVHQYGTAAFLSVTLQQIPSRGDRYQIHPPHHELYFTKPPLERKAQIQRKTIQNHCPLLFARGNNDDVDDVLGDAVDSIISFASTPIPISVLPGPPLSLFYILSLFASAILLPGSNSVIIISSFIFFAFFLALGRNLIFGDPLEEEGEDDNDDDDAIVTEAVMVDLVALGGSIISSYLLIPQDIIISKSEQDGGGSILFILGLGGILSITGILLKDRIALLSRNEDESPSSAENDNPSKRLMDLWDEKFSDGDK